MLYILADDPAPAISIARACGSYYKISEPQGRAPPQALRFNVLDLLLRGNLNSTGVRKIW